MNPNSRWFPTNLQDRAAWFQNFVTNFSPIATTLGFTGGEVTAIQADNEDFQSIAATTVALDTFASAVRAYRISLTEGDVGAAFAAQGLFLARIGRAVEGAGVALA